jgi:hypothetical protein
MFVGSAARQLLTPQQPGGGSQRIKLVNDVPGMGRAGETIQLTLSPSDVVAPSVIVDTLIFGYKQLGMRADEVAPVQLVDRDVGKYQIFGPNNVFRLVNILASTQGDVPEVDVDRATADYGVQDRALGGFVPTITQYNADNTPGSLDPKAQIVKRIAEVFSLEREVRVWTQLKATATWATANKATLAGGSEWTVGAHDALQDVFDRLNASAQPVTDIWMNPIVAQAFIKSPSVATFLKAMGGDAPVGRDIVDAAANQRPLDFTVPGLPPIHIVSGKVLNESTGALDWILDDTVIFTSNPPGAGTSGDDLMTVKTIRRKGPSGNGWMSREFPLDRRGPYGGTFVMTTCAEQLAIISGTVGGALYNTLP